LFENVIFTANIVAPVFLIIAVGYFAKRKKIINEVFVDVTSRFVFQISLPVFIFLKISTLDLSQVLQFDQILYIYLGTIITFLLIWAGAIPFIKNPKDKSAFIQGAFRGNYAIIGLALISNLFGTNALGKATVILAFLLPLYNVLAVIVLTVPMHEGKVNIKKALLDILLNPLILAVIIALPFSYFTINLPEMFVTTGMFVSDLALPLALIGIGGSLNIEELKRASNLAFTSSIIKIVATPIFLTIGAYFLGYTKDDLGIMFIIFACPTAIASFVLADAMGANSRLAGNIIMLTTLGSVFTIAIGILLLKSIGLI
jgi:malonate transporter and related proteins